MFTLGEATIEEIEALDEMKKERDKKQEKYISRTNSLFQGFNLIKKLQIYLHDSLYFKYINYYIAVTKKLRNG